MVSKCTQCGADIRDGVAFCTECGSRAPETAQSAASATVCASCGMPMEEELAFCTSCGTKKAEAAPTAPVTPPPVTPPPPLPRREPPPAAPVYQTPPPQQPMRPAPQQTLEQSVKGTKYEPITTGGFIGIMLLLCIPVIGLILLIVWACGGCRKISKRSFARATLILGIIMTVLSLVISLVFGSLIQSFLRDAGLDTSNLGQSSSWIAEDNDPDQGIADEDDPLGALGELEDLLEGLEGLGGQENFSGN